MPITETGPAVMGIFKVLAQSAIFLVVYYIVIWNRQGAGPRLPRACSLAVSGDDIRKIA